QARSLRAFAILGTGADAGLDYSGPTMLSAVIPVLNEVESLAMLHAELSDTAKKSGYDLEIIFVDDGSTDGSWEKIEELATADPRVRGIRLRRDFGKAAALSAGFEARRGDCVVTLDCDLQGG